MTSPMYETALTISLGEAELAALDRSIRDTTLTREQALSRIVASWAAAQPVVSGHPATDEGMRPSELNASNDV